MKTIFRWALYIVGAFVLLSIGLSIAVAILVDPNDYRTEIETAVTDATGRSFSIEGDIDLHAFPCCGIGLGPLELGNPEGFAEESFARVERVAVDVQLWPLLVRQELAIGDVVLNGFDVRLISRKDGAVNWEFAAAEAGSSETAEPNSAAGTGLNDLDIASIEIASGKLSYLDEATGDLIQVGDIELSTGAIRSEESFDLTASLNVSGLAPQLVVNTQLDTRAALDAAAGTVALTDLTLEVDAAGPDLPGGEAQVKLSLAQVSDLGTDQLTLEGLRATLRAAGVVVVVSGAGEVTDGVPTLQGDLHIEPFSPQSLLARLGEPLVVTADPTVLQTFELQAQWSLADDVAGLQNLQLQLDDTQATGALTATSLERQSVEFALQFDALDADRYLAPATDEAAAGGASSAAASDELDLPVEDLRALNLRGQLGFGSLRVAEALLTNVDMQLSAQEGLLRVHPLTADIYGGGYAGDIRMDVRKQLPSMAANEKLTGFQIGEYLRDSNGNENLTGQANVRFTATTFGTTITALTENLLGDVAMDLQDGRYQGIDIWYEIRATRATLKGATPPPAPAEPYTDISRLSGSAKLANGIAKNDDLQMQIPFLRVVGRGDINLLASLVDYQLSAKVIGSPQFDDGFVMDDLQGLTIPIGLTGALDDPDIEVDLNAVLSNLAQREAKKQLLKKLGVEETNGANNKTNGADSSQDSKDQLKQGLKNLLGR